MERLIEQLLEDFEHGRLTRRQLIRGLALAAVSAPAAAAAQAPGPAPASNPAPWKTVCLDHISYAVADYRKSTAFYQNLMGWEIRNDNNTNQASLAIPNVGNIIIRNRRQPAPGTDAAQPGRPPITGVINHVSYGIQPWDTQAVEAELKRRGLNPRPDMVGDNFKSFHVLDPDGWDLQISNATPANRA
jgi:catechol 2,3-dioxygenase-like lactoylglutathione lyase family enzyme